MFTEAQIKRLLENATPESEFHQIMSAYLAILQSAQKCASCSDTENLTEVCASADGSTYHLCRQHLREESQR